MKITGKETGYYWDIIKLPLFVYVMLSIIALALNWGFFLLPALIVAAGYVG